MLLTADMRAKISDLGVAKIVDANPIRMSTMTKTPGTQCYMPPETMVPKPRYSIKVNHCTCTGPMFGNHIVLGLVLSHKIACRNGIKLQTLVLHSVKVLASVFSLIMQTSK